MKRKWLDPELAATIQTLGALTTIAIGVLTGVSYIWEWLHGSSGRLLSLLTQTVEAPFWVILAVPVLAIMLSGYAGKWLYARSIRAGAPSTQEAGKTLPPAEISAAAKPHLVTAADPSTAILVPTDIVSSPQGTISVMVLIHPEGEGIRNVKNNKYILAHAGQRGLRRPVPRYLDVLAVSCSPSSTAASGRVWRLWIANSHGDELKLEVNDDLYAPTPKWHIFGIRWDHDRSRLELIIDGEVVRESADYRACWPTSRGQIMFGAWPSLTKVHFAETELLHISMHPIWTDVLT